MPRGYCCCPAILGSTPVGGRIVPYRAPGRNPRPLERGPTLPHGRLNLLAAIVIYWNTAHLGEAVRPRKHAGLTVEPELLAHISPLGWAHILLTGEYR